MAVQFEGIRISELFACSPEEQDEKIAKFLETVLNPTDAQLHQQQEAIDFRIRKLEGRYEMSSNTMRQKLSRGQIKETADICSWLMLLKAREDQAGDEVLEVV